jgi:glycosyltransferase involved in cell wall biosynthesis
MKIDSLLLSNFFKRKSQKKTGLLVVGHDLKFMPPVIDYYRSREDYSVETFSYSGHLVQQKDQLLKILPDFNLIYCEWGLDNISFLSRHKQPGQKLMVRIHLQEFITTFLDSTNWENVDVIIFACQFQMERFIKRFPKYRDKCKLIFVAIDCDAFFQPKEPDAIFTLGIVGILPMRKAPHQALEILSELRKSDNRYKLSVKSKRPEELAWLWSRPEERAYYDEFYASVQSLGLSDSVIFESHGNDVETWFRKAGFLLSTSEFEGSHQAVAEGMAAGSIPVIRNWEGADTLYPGKFIYKDVNEAVEIIRKYVTDTNFTAESNSVNQYARQHFDSCSVIPQFDQLFDLLRK